jgi:hypothetical protein
MPLPFSFLFNTVFHMPLQLVHDVFRDRWSRLTFLVSQPVGETMLSTGLDADVVGT